MPDSRNRSQKLLERYYPAGARNGTAAFYGWVRQYTDVHTVMLNLGAGAPTNNSLRIFQGEVRRVAGADVDPIVLSNRELDDAHLCAVNGPLPFDNATFDLVLCDFVLEHVERPMTFLAEVYRVLKPGCSFFFRTPNRYHYVSLIARATPHWFHGLVANRVRGLPAHTHEPWPTYHRMNSRAVLRRLAAAACFSSSELQMYEAEPSYLVFNPFALVGGIAYERIVNRFDALAGLRADIFGRLVK